jgi:NADH-quinone oxidoreductase subunit M
VYSLRIMQRVFYGTERRQHKIFPDLSLREKLILIPMVVVIILLGLFPSLVFEQTKNSVQAVLKNMPLNDNAKNVSTVQLLNSDSHEPE